MKGLTIMVNSIYDGWRFEDVWLDKSGRRAALQFDALRTREMRYHRGK